MDPHSEYSPSPEDWDYDANPVREKIPQVRFLSGFEETLKSPPGPVLARLNNLYNAEVIGADRQLGRLLDFLDDMPGGEEVAVIFSSDHGEELYETWHRIGHGFSMTEGVLHVPLAIRAPGIEPGRSAALVETLSITPTILGLLGLEAPYPLDGGSLLSPRPGRTAARSFESGVAMTLRTAEHRFWRRTVQNAPTREWAPWRLQAPWFEQPDCLASYDGPWQNMPRWIDVTDPQHELLVGNLRNEARQILASINESVIENIDDEAFLEQLRELGYLGDDEG